MSEVAWSANSRAVHAAWLAHIKAQGGPVAQGGAIPHADTTQAPGSEKTGLERALEDAIVRGDVSTAYTAFVMLEGWRLLAMSDD